jgi:hypothetical protein
MTFVTRHTPEQIIQAAKEAAAWCNLKFKGSNHRSELRTLEFGVFPFGNHHYYTVNDIICARKYELEKLKIEPVVELNKGKLLVYEPDSNVFDGLSEEETLGFLDVNDCPPWDTWVGYIELSENRVLLSWVPDTLIKLIDEGVEVNCTDCFYWLDTVDELWAKELANA